VRFLGLDYGARRIGLALSDPTGLLARPWKTIARRGTPRDVASTIAAEADALSRESDGLAGIVIGFPRTLGGDATDQTAAVQAIADLLRTLSHLPVTLQDERLSSREAESLLARRIKHWRDRKPLLDAASAAVILQDYLDSRPASSPGSNETVEDRRS
jgi:putative holliday junction resolvase